MVFTFFGQLTGTSVGANLYAKHGWLVSQSFSVGSIGCALLITFARGPWEKGWIGWHGGLSIKKKSKSSADGHTEEARNALRRMSTEKERPPMVTSNADPELEKGAAVQESQAIPGLAKAEEKSSDGAGEDCKETSDEEKGSSRSEEDLARSEAIQKAS